MLVTAPGEPDALRERIDLGWGKEDEIHKKSQKVNRSKVKTPGNF